MFGLKLKLWMEAHLGRARHKSSSSTTTTNSNSTQNNKHHKQPTSYNDPTGSIVPTISSTTASHTEFPPFLAETKTDPVATEGTADSHSSAQQGHESPNQPQSFSSAGSAHSASILGSFATNLSLSSPDTGYSTDGFSPKSIFPALSFESSTPKSSYTISSLVSSELNNSSSISCIASTKSICTVPSRNSSLANGLETDTSEVSLPVPTSNPEDNNAAEKVVKAARYENELGNVVKAANNNNNEASEKVEESQDSHTSSNNMRTGPPAHFNHHRRTESMDGKVRDPSVGLVDPLRPIRASLLLSSHIPAKCCYPGLKNAFSLCSPRRQRTKIKTNPWISFHESQRSPAQPAALPNKSQLEPILGSSDDCASKKAEDPVETAAKMNEQEGERPEKVLYRISTSTSVSDSGKGSSLEPGTNRNSTESSVLLLSDSASSSTRNSIISPDNEQQSSQAVQFYPKLPVPKAPTLAAPAAVKTELSVSSVKETDILSDWTQTEDDDEEVTEGEDGTTEGAVIETDECITPTPSSPSMSFSQQNSTSSATDWILPSSTFTPTGVRAACENYLLSPPGGVNTDRLPNFHHATTTSKSACNNNALRSENSHWDSDLSTAAVAASLEPPKNGAANSKDTQNSARGSSGAFGFLRKMFRKTASFSPRTPRLGKATRFLRSSRSNSLTQEKESDTIIPAALLSPQSVVVSAYPHANTKSLSPAIHSSFLTPTPNAFRKNKRNRDSGSECSEGKAAVSKVVQHHGALVKTDIIRLPPSSSSFSSSSSQPGAIPESSNAPYYYNQTQAAQEQDSKTNTMSTTSSHSLSIMSTSTTSKSEGARAPEPPPRTPRTSMQVERKAKPKAYIEHCNANVAAKIPVVDSPRLMRINSPSFNNYSPIHRLVVTGGNHHLLQHNHHHHARVPQSPLLHSAHPSHYNPSPQRTPQPINRHQQQQQQVHHPTASPLINHHIQQQQHPSGLSSANSTPVAFPLNPNHFQAAPHHPFIASPSPILRNPRYQYITSSNQNSPLLNVPKRLQAPSAVGVVPPYYPGLGPGSEFDRAGIHQRRFESESADPRRFVPSTESRPLPENFNNNFVAQRGIDSTDGGFLGPGNERFYDPPAAVPIKSRDCSLRRNLMRSGGGSERIYESVDDSHDEEDDDHDDDDDEMRSYEGNGGGDEGRDFGDPHSRMMMGDYRAEYSSSSRPARGEDLRARHSRPIAPRGRSHTAFPMTLGTYLSETESRLLETERERDTDRKYKRLINEAQALLHEISVEKSLQQQQQRRQQEEEIRVLGEPHTHRNAQEPLHWYSRQRESVLRQDECPQSDPLRRKAYDCWALRRLQQELAGCYASPPVLHRSRLQITSPTTHSSPSNPSGFRIRQQQPSDLSRYNNSRRNSFNNNHRAC